MAKYSVVIPYVHTQDNGNELRHALRSLHNIRNWDGRVFVVGDYEEWFSSNVIHIRCRRIYGSPYKDVENKIMVAVRHKLVPKHFILSNDDIFITRPTTIKPMHSGELIGNDSKHYQRARMLTAKWLKERGVETPLDYGVHVPMIINKQKRTEVHTLIQNNLNVINLQARSVYGNLFIDPQEAVFYADRKTKTGHLKSGNIISTSYFTSELTNKFPKPSKFETTGNLPTVHMIWLGSALPDKYKQNIKTYESLGYEVRLHTKVIPNMQNKNLYDAMKTWAGKADILRLEILYQQGGIYTDTDSKAHAILPLISDLVCMTSASGFIANETIYAKKGHPALKEALDKLPAHLDSLLKRQECNIWEICGATYITPIFSKYKHVKLPKHRIGNRKSRPSIIEHSYDGSWSEGVGKSKKRPIGDWLDITKLGVNK